MPYRIVGRGADLVIEVDGPTLADCLIAAVEGFAGALAETEGAQRRTEPVSYSEASPADLLVALVDDAIVRLDADGELAVGLEVEEAADGALRGLLELVSLDDVAVHGVAPKAATWHEVRLEPAGDGWAGSVMIDL